MDWNNIASIIIAIIGIFAIIYLYDTIRTLKKQLLRVHLDMGKIITRMEGWNDDDDEEDNKP